MRISYQCNLGYKKLNELKKEMKAIWISPWPEMTDIINILIRCEFEYHVEFGFICDY